MQDYKTDAYTAWAEGLHETSAILKLSPGRYSPTGEAPLIFDLIPGTKGISADIDHVGSRSLAMDQEIIVENAPEESPFIVRDPACGESWFSFSGDVREALWSIERTTGTRITRMTDEEKEFARGERDNMPEMSDREFYGLAKECHWYGTHVDTDEETLLDRKAERDKFLFEQDLYARRKQIEQQDSLTLTFEDGTYIAETEEARETVSMSPHLAAAMLDADEAANYFGEPVQIRMMNGEVLHTSYPSALPDSIFIEITPREIYEATGKFPTAFESETVKQIRNALDHARRVIEHEIGRRVRLSEIREELEQIGPDDIPF